MAWAGRDGKPSVRRVDGVKFFDTAPVRRPRNGIHCRDIENLKAAAARHGATRFFIGCVNYEGPHHKDVAPAAILPIVLRPKPPGLLFQACNPCRARVRRSKPHLGMLALSSPKSLLEAT